MKAANFSSLAKFGWLPKCKYIPAVCRCICAFSECDPWKYDGIMLLNKKTNQHHHQPCQVITVLVVVCILHLTLFAPLPPVPFNVHAVSSFPKAKCGINGYFSGQFCWKNIFLFHTVSAKYAVRNCTNPHTCTICKCCIPDSSICTLRRSKFACFIYFIFIFLLSSENWCSAFYWDAIRSNSIRFNSCEMWLDFMFGQICWVCLKHKCQLKHWLIDAQQRDGGADHQSV